LHDAVISEGLGCIHHCEPFAIVEPFAVQLALAVRRDRELGSRAKVSRECASVRIQESDCMNVSRRRPRKALELLCL
jgi:hypothetical protein